METAASHAKAHCIEVNVVCKCRSVLRVCSQSLGHWRSFHEHSLLPESSGYISRSHGIAGSTNGRGVLASTNNGRFMATLEPRRCLIFAVSVLYVERISTQSQHTETLSYETHTGTAHADLLFLEEEISYGWILRQWGHSTAP